MKRTKARVFANAAAAAAALIIAAVAVLGYRHWLVQQLRAPVLEQLGDPDAAKFRNERFVGPWTVASGVLCGEVNARNRAGGYDGYQLFLSHGGKVHIEPEVVRETMAKTRGGRPGHEQECTPSMMSEEVEWWWLRW